VVVPENLEWLVFQNEITKQVTKRVCDAKVISRKGDFRNWAKVPQLLNAEVPYIPREFSAPFVVGQIFKCFITFGHNGALVKPTVGGEDMA
jgi:hypothetical protein